MFVNIKVLRTEVINLGSEQVIFIVFPHFSWSIQVKPRDYYNWIRERLEGHKGIVKKKKADYLLYLIIEAIMGNYQETYLNHEKISDSQLNATHIKPTPELTSPVEKRKQELFNF